MSKIEWTEKTWNPITGCTKISAGCKNCYAETMALRLQKMGTRGYENGFKLTYQEHKLDYPKTIKKPTTFFVCSMSDLFHEKVNNDWLDEIFEVIYDTPQHTYQILTKRPENMFDYFDDSLTMEIPRNCILGTTIENKQSLARLKSLEKLALLDMMMKQPDQEPTKLFLSIEPLLEDLGELDLTDIDWIIVGGESGSKARPMQKEWVLNIQRQCKEQNVPFFFKQWGTWGEDGIKRSKKANGRLLEGQIFNGRIF